MELKFEAEYLNSKRGYDNAGCKLDRHYGGGPAL